MAKKNKNKTRYVQPNKLTTGDNPVTRYNIIHAPHAVVVEQAQDDRS